MERFIQASVWVYGKLLAVYPREVRVRFASDMTEIFEDLLHDAAAQRGAAGIVVQWRRALLEFATVALAARLESHLIIAGTLSFVVSSLITWIFLRAVG
jgi:hypothetical protein